MQEQWVLPLPRYLLLMVKLILFDIDGTLMEESPTHTAAFDYVCKEIYGVDTDIKSFPSHAKKLVPVHLTDKTVSTLKAKSSENIILPFTDMNL